MWHDLQDALRLFAAQRLLNLVVVLLLGVAVGVNTLIFSFVNAVLLRPLPISTANNLFLLEKSHAKQVRPDTSCFYQVYKQIQSRKDLFSSAIAVQQWTQQSFQPLENGDTVSMVSTEIVSDNYFSDLGIKVILGRPLSVADATATTDIPIVISHSFWTRQLNKDRNIVGKQLRIKHFPFRVVGVLPEGFNGIDIDRSPDVRLPVSASLPFSGKSLNNSATYGQIQFQVALRLKPNMQSSTAAAAILSNMRETDAALYRNMLMQQNEVAGINNKPKTPDAQVEQLIRVATSYQVRLQGIPKGISSMRSQFKTALYVLICASVLLLVAVSISVSGLLVASIERRKSQIAIRMALGATRFQLVRQLFIQISALAILGGCFAALFSWGLSPVLLRMLPQIRGLVPLYATPPVVDLRLDSRDYGFLLLSCAVATCIALIFPIWRILRLDLNSHLTQHQGSSPKPLVNNITISIQVALCVVFICGASLIGRTFWQLEHLNPGFDRSHVLEVDLDPLAIGYSGNQLKSFLSDLRVRLALLPGVTSVGSSIQGLMRGVGMKTTVAPEGVTLPENTFANANISIVTRDHFNALGIKLISGRLLEEKDRNFKPAPVVVNQAFAKLFFSQSSPLGHRLVSGVDGKAKPFMTIVGVVATSKFRSMREDNPPILYSLDNDQFIPTITYVRTNQSPSMLVGTIYKVVRTMNPRVPIVGVSTLEQEVQASLWQERMLTVLSALFVCMTVVITTASIYGSLMFNVVSRLKEVGIRLSLGAKARDIIVCISKSLFVAICGGLASGLILAIVLLSLVKQLFFGVEGVDTFTVIVAISCVVVLALSGAFVPLVRAIRTDPATVMRTQ